MNQQEFKVSQSSQGVLLVAITYIIWGLFPLFWKLLEQVSSFEILLNRVIWSFVFTLLFVTVFRGLPKLLLEIRYIMRNKVQALYLAGASLVITFNWFLYIWAVNHDHVLQTSLGYYMNPLITVLFGVLFFKEKLSKLTVIAVAIAAIGVTVLTIFSKEFPFVSISLAVSFAIYSVLKKKVTIEATRGLVIETSFMLPISLVLYGFYMSKNDAALFAGDYKVTLLLMVSGIVTAVPLVLFAKGATKIPLYLVGFIQYLSPTLVLLLGVYLYNEPFTGIELFAFSCIWIAVLLFSVGKMLESRQDKTK